MLQIVAKKIAPIFGAALGVYFAAILQSGPEVVDANLCKMARRFFKSVPDQCAPLVDTYGFWASVIVAFVCIVAFLLNIVPLLRGAGASSNEKNMRLEIQNADRISVEDVKSQGPIILTGVSRSTFKNIHIRGPNAKR